MEAHVPPPEKGLQFGPLTTACGLYAAFGGAASFLGWPLDVPRLADWGDTGVSIQPNTAILIALCGVALLLVQRGWGRPASMLGGLVALVGGATLLQHVVGADFGFNHQLLFDRPWGRAATVTPGRPGPPASSSLLLLGTALLVLGSSAPGPLRSRRLVPLAGLAVCALMTFGVSGFLFGARSFYAIPWLSAIALQTASMLIAVGMGVVTCVPDAQPMRLLASRSGAGMLARRALPALVLLPLTLGWLRMRGEDMGLYDPGTGRALLVVGLILLGLAVLWWPLLELARKEESERRARRAAREGEALVRTLGEAVPDLLWMTDADGTPLYQNPAWQGYTDLLPPTDHATGGPPDALDGAAPLRRLWVEARARGEPFRFETRLVRHDGEVRWFTGRTVPLQGEDGRIVRWVGTLADIHALKVAEEALRDNDRRKDEFLAILAHELRNPLAPLRNGLEMMRVASDPGIQERARTIMERQLAGMVRLVDDLLDLERISRGKFELRRKRVALAEVVQLAMETARPVIETRAHTVSIDAPGEPVFVDGDPTRLAQVVANVLDNAAKYTDQGGRITVVVGRDGEWAVVRIVDSGAGIPAQMLGRIFERFTQVDQELDRSPGGLGIGLSLVRELVELHGGNVEAQSAGRGRGSEFIVRLPIATPPPHQENGATDLDAARSPGARRVLVVDDNQDTATSLATLVELLGNETKTAFDGLEALATAESFRPDVVLLDIGMPKLDGLEVCRRIRARPWSGKTVVVACTGWGQEEDKRRSTEAGFDHHVVKPVDPATLRALLTLERGASRPAP